MPLPSPSMSSPSSTTLSVAAALIVIPFVPADTSLPPSIESQRIVIDLVMVTGPKSPALTQLISPRATVIPWANWNVRQGNATVQGLPSLPVPETQVCCSGCAPELGLTLSVDSRNAVP